MTDPAGRRVELFVDAREARRPSTDVSMRTASRFVHVTVRGGQRTPGPAVAWRGSRGREELDDALRSDLERSRETPLANARSPET